MSESQPPEYNPDANPQGVAAPEQQAPEPWSPPGYQAPVPPQYQPSGVVQSPQYGGAPAMTELTAAERFWYLLGNIAFGAMYLAKVPAKKAFSDFGLVEMTGGEKTWYTILCLMFGAGYFAKIPTAKALSEMDQFRSSGRGLTSAEKFWYVLGNIAFGAMYLMKVPAKKAFSDFGLVQLTEGENTWYIVLCIMYGRGYFNKIPVAKAITETDQLRPGGYGQIPAAGFGG